MTRIRAPRRHLTSYVPGILLAMAITSASSALAAPGDRILRLYKREKLSGADVGTYKVVSHLGKTPQALADRVGSLPGWGEPHFGMYSGYVAVDEAAGRALFYVMAEATVDPGTAPLILWLNGGPGCSSLGGGFLSELGPYYPTRKEGKLVANPNSWNRKANVLFLESPAFVGFSYSNTTSDSVVGDKRTALDAYRFLLEIMKRFPELADRPLWLSGESYGGHYVPGLADAIVKGNEAGESPRLNLQGFLVGNPWTDASLDNQGAVDFWYGHAIISTSTAEGIKKYCDFSSVGPLRGIEIQGEPEQITDPGKCNHFILKSQKEMGNINIYDIFADVCLRAEQAVVEQLAKALDGVPGGMSSRQALNVAFNGSGRAQNDYDPCVDSEVELYFNNPDVQAALHANISGMLPYRWSDCTPSSRLQYSRDDLLSSMVPVYEALLGKGLRMLVYSGDIDAIVPVTGTRKWVEALGLDIVSEYRPWTSSIDGQVAGWTQSFTNGLTFATVRGAGHMVPYTQPERAYDMVTRFIHGMEL